MKRSMLQQIIREEIIKELNAGTKYIAASREGYSATKIKAYINTLVKGAITESQYKNKNKKIKHIHTFESFLNESTVKDPKLIKGAYITIELDDQDGDFSAGDYQVVGLTRGGVIMSGMGKNKLEVSIGALNDAGYTVNEAKRLMKRVKTFESFLNEDLYESANYAVMLTGGSIGDKPRPRDAKGYAGMNASKEELFTKEKAKEKADRMNKTVLSSGEKIYYKLKYVIVPVQGGKFIKE